MKKSLILTLALLFIVALICSCGNDTDDTLSANDTQSNIDSVVDSNISSDKQENTESDTETDTDNSGGSNEDLWTDNKQ